MFLAANQVPFSRAVFLITVQQCMQTPQWYLTSVQARPATSSLLTDGQTASLSTAGGTSRMLRSRAITLNFQLTRSGQTTATLTGTLLTQAVNSVQTNSTATVTTKHLCRLSRMTVLFLHSSPTQVLLTTILGMRSTLKFSARTQQRFSSTTIQTAQATTKR